MTSRALLAALTLGLCSCSTVHVPIPVLRAAEINLRGRSMIAVEAGLANAATRQVVSRVRQRVGASPHVKLVERSTRAAVMVLAKVERADVAETMERQRRKCTKYDRNNKPYPSECVWSTRRVKVDVAATFDIIDLETTQNLRPKHLPCKEAREGTAVDEEPDAIDGRELIDQCLESIATTLAKALVPWEELVEVPFKDDGDLPMLAKGIELARNRDLKGAIRLFGEAITKAESEPSIAAPTRAKAYANLGAALAYSNEFVDAGAAVDKAMALDADERDYVVLRAEIRILAANHQKLSQQIGSSAADGQR